MSLKKKKGQQSESTAMQVRGGVKRTKGYRFRRNLIYTLMVLPAFIMSVMFHDIPMPGMILAFKNYTYRDGIFGSEWCGWDNFRYFFESDQLVRLFRNTVFFSIGSLLLVNLASGIIGALLLFEIRRKKHMKICQTSMLLPNFISIMAVTYIVFLVLNPTQTGIINSIRQSMGLELIDFYNEPGYWRPIILGVSLWQNMGMAALYDYGALLAIDPALYEAATIDGANWFQRVRYISLPGMSSMICMTLITQAAGILGSSLGPYYLTMNSGALYETTDVIAAYMYRSITSGSFGASSALSLFLSVFGSVMVITVNLIIKKIDPEKSLF